MLSRPAGTYGAQAPARALKACSGANMLSRLEFVPEPDPAPPGLESMPHVLAHWPKVVPRKLLKRLGRMVCQKKPKRCLILPDRCYNAWRRIIRRPGEKEDAREGSPFLGHSVTCAGEARERGYGDGVILEPFAGTLWGAARTNGNELRRASSPPRYAKP